MNHIPQGRVYFFIPRIDLFADVRANRALKVYRMPLFKGYIKFIFRAFYDLFLLPVVSMILNPSAVIVLANYSPMVVRGKKIVFLRHPFLVDDSDDMNRDLNRMMIEGLRKFIFRITLLTADILVVQSDFMKQAFLKKYGHVKRQIHVLPNPLSNLIDYTPPDSPDERDRENAVLYVSRFAPHKRHMFLLDLVDTYRRELRNKGIRFYITVDPSKGLGPAQAFLDEIDKRQLNDIIHNLGEIPNEALSRYYRSAKCLFFPSVNETFGNPLIEAMAFALPMVVPELDYAKSICGEAGLYYKSNNMHEAYEKIAAVTDDPLLQEEYSRRSRLRLRKIPSAEQWIDEIISLVK
jgi:glycosyltransferase involved in cell wall biosynthesis